MVQDFLDIQKEAIGLEKVLLFPTYFKKGARTLTF